jgi:hypothetical protein
MAGSGGGPSRRRYLPLRNVAQKFGNPSPFLSLPKELRLEIYEHAFSASSYPILVAIHRDYHCMRSRYENTLHPTRTVTLRYVKHPTISFPTALLRTNRQIYHEALPVMYGDITFFPTPNTGLFSFFLDRLSKFAQGNIRRARISPSGHLASVSTDCSRLFWAVMCAQLACLPSLYEVEILHSSPNDLRDLWTDQHRKRILKPLCLIKVKKVFVYDRIDGYTEEVEEREKRFRRLLEME